MKTSLIIMVVLLAFNIIGYCQPITPLSQPVGNEYLLKAKKQNSAAKVLLITGGAFSVTGFALGAANVWDEIGASFDNRSDGGYVTGVVFMITGAAAMAGSIPLFIAASKNRRRATSASVSLIMNEHYEIRHSSMATNRHPALSLKINL